MAAKVAYPVLKGPKGDLLIVAMSNVKGPKAKISSAFSKFFGREPPLMGRSIPDLFKRGWHAPYSMLKPVLFDDALWRQNEGILISASPFATDIVGAFSEIPLLDLPADRSGMISIEGKYGNSESCVAINKDNLVRAGASLVVHGIGMKQGYKIMGESSDGVSYRVIITANLEQLKEVLALYNGKFEEGRTGNEAFREKLGLEDVYLYNVKPGSLVPGLLGGSRFGAGFGGGDGGRFGGAVALPPGWQSKFRHIEQDGMTYVVESATEIPRLMNVPKTQGQA